MKDNLPIEKAQKQHMRTSKTGKMFNAGKGPSKLTNSQISRLINQLPEGVVDEADSIGRDYARSDMPDAINRLLFDNKIDKKYKPVLLRVARDSADELEDSMKEHN